MNLASLCHIIFISCLKAEDRYLYICLILVFFIAYSLLVFWFCLFNFAGVEGNQKKKKKEAHLGPKSLLRI